MKRWLAGVIAALVIVGGLGTPVAATGNSSNGASYNQFYFKDFTADYYLSKAADGTSRLRVYETLTAVFPETGSTNHGITRVIPYTNQNGKNLTMARDDLLEINAWQNGKEVRPYKVEGGDGFFTVYLGDADTIVSGEQVYELEYEFVNVITEFTEKGKTWQELYWDTNGNDWSQKFDNVTARVYFDDDGEWDVRENFTGESWCYVGRYGESGSGRCKTQEFDGGVQFSAQNLRSGENLTFVLDFAADSFVVPGPVKDYHLVIVAGIVLLVFIAELVGIFVLLRLSAAKRHYYKNLFVKPEYTPPKGFTVAEMGMNYLKSSRLGSTKVATLMELATSHRIEIIKRGPKSGKWAIRIKSLDLTAEQVAMLKIMQGNTNALTVGQEIELKKRTANSTLIKLGQDFERFTREALERKGLSEPGSANAGHKKKDAPKAKNPAGWLIVAASIWFIAGIFGMIFVMADTPSYREVVGESFLIPIIIVTFMATFVIALIVGGHLSLYFTTTETGLEYSRYLDGLKEYMKLAEKERLEFLQSVKGADTSHQGVVKLYEKLLPYAVLFRLEKSWLKELSRYYEFDDVSAPTWYVGVGVFNAHEFSTAMTQASSFMNAATTHSTTSNSSSGFSGGGGGGFSGGGGGGGGGGGW